MSENTKQISAGEVRPGTYLVFDGIACNVKSVEKSKTGKHGSMKCRIEAISLTDGRKFIKIMPGHDNIDVPIVEKKAAQVLSVSGKKVNVMDVETFETFDLEIPEDVEGVKEGEQVIYWTMLGQRVLRSKK